MGGYGFPDMGLPPAYGAEGEHGGQDEGGEYMQDANGQYMQGMQFMPEMYDPSCAPYGMPFGWPGMPMDGHGPGFGGEGVGPDGQLMGFGGQLGPDGHPDGNFGNGFPQGGGRGDQAGGPGGGEAQGDGTGRKEGRRGKGRKKEALAEEKAAAAAASVGKPPLPAMGCDISKSGFENATTTSGKSYHSKCICVGCGLSDNMCGPALATSIRCCCFEANVKVDPSQCQETRDLCMGRMGCKAGPFVADITNPLVDNHELVVVVEKKVV